VVSLSKSKCLQWPPELAVWQSRLSQVWRQTVPHSGSSSCDGPVSETAGRPMMMMMTMTITLTMILMLIGRQRFATFVARCNWQRGWSDLCCVIYRREPSATPSTTRAPRTVRRGAGNLLAPEKDPRCGTAVRDLDWTRCETPSAASPPTTRCHHLPPVVATYHQRSSPTTRGHHLPPDVTTYHQISPPTTSGHHLPLDFTTYHQWSPPTTRCHHLPPVVITYHQISPPTTSGHHLPPDVTTYHQRSPPTTRGNHLLPEVTTYHQWSPPTTRGHHLPPDVTTYHQRSKYSEEDDEEQTGRCKKRKKKPFSLPHWTIYIAWIRESSWLGPDRVERVLKHAHIPEHW